MKRVKISKLQRGDIILTTTTAAVSKAIRWGTKSDISHAIICVQHRSVIDATSEGVHARNPQRLFFDDKCALHVLRLGAPPSADQIDQICRFAREKVGSEYSTREAVRSAIGGSDQWTRKQFCSRLVAQAYASAGITLVGNPHYCSPADLAKSPVLTSVPDAVEQVSDEEVGSWTAHADSSEVMRKAINTFLEGARTKDKNIQTFEDVGPYLIQHPAEDTFFSKLLESSGYLTVWQLNAERNRWQYEDALLAELPADKCKEYCRGMVKDEEAGPHRYVTNRAAYRGLSHQHDLAFFKLLFDLFDLLAAEHRQRLMVARRWLEMKGMIAPVADVIVQPHSPDWFSSMESWDPVKAAVTRFVIKQESREDVCSICGDDPAADYRLEKGFRPPGGPDTLRLCDDCLEIRRSMGDPFTLIR
ncbi:YiiX/YebB-like N1pC/P60 family cysteine hydrolase [Bradyrhizobium sp. SZCCHNR2035]|uniref:YiiX/YebB-like N1pC/P60 family cysteine hydrolase n=1 Tax=Bradyrhizobium sp. SZCCHNR2035 TaxID=3057386 RepID=UPI0029170578|nr:YiiX/YebB-like N1pC/P60 family cysteine hydrolase [Bradyrhizobium sp. SZCCHNR2035]